MINIIDEKKKIRQIPEIPFITKDEDGEYYLVAFDENNSKYRYVNLNDGAIKCLEYDDLDEMFNDKFNENDEILDCDLVVKTR
jgi:hypothetical protein